MELINQPFRGMCLGNKLIELLTSSKFETFDFVVAFAKNSGVLRIRQALDAFRGKGGKINAYVGIDLGGTTYEAITNLYGSTDSLHVVHFEDSQTFHPKMYVFKGSGKTVLIVGSNNMTGGGLWSNVESSLLVDGIESDEETGSLTNAFDRYLAELKSLGQSCLRITSQGQIDVLLEKGYLPKELDTVFRRGERVAPGTDYGKKLFGDGLAVHGQECANPNVAYLHDSGASVSTVMEQHPSTLVRSDLQTFWIESKAMTGGSRNILDLSKRSLLESGNPSGTVFDLNDPHFIRGAVEFFGLDPMDETVRKDITLNFEGVDYHGNTILYPKGDKANGTWRIQIKGISNKNEEITSKFRKIDSANSYLANKILAFSKVDGDYYYLSIFGIDQMENFIQSSSILARNGHTKTAKQMGLIRNG